MSLFLSLPLSISADDNVPVLPSKAQPLELPHKAGLARHQGHGDKTVWAECSIALKAAANTLITGSLTASTTRHALLMLLTN